MPELSQAFIFSFTATCFLAFILIYIHLEERSRYIVFWGFGLTLYLGAYVCESYGLKNNESLIYGIISYFLPLMLNLFLLIGTYHYINKPFPKWPVFYVILSTFWFIAGILNHFPFLFFAIPLFIPLGAICFWIGIEIIRFWRSDGMNRLITGWAVILLGLHAADYPIVRSNPAIAAWGFVMDALLKLTIGICMLIEFSYKTKKILAENEKRFRLLTENAQDIVYRYRLDPNPGFDYISPAVTRITGYTPDEFYHDPQLIIKITHPEDVPFLEEMMRNSDISPATFVLRWIRKDQIVIWLEGKNSPTVDKAGKLLMLDGIMRDITERKKVEFEHELQRAYFKQLFETSPEGIVIINQAGKIIDINRGFETLFQYGIDELRGRTLEEIIVPQEFMAEGLELSKTAFERGNCHKETVRCRKDGSLIDVEVLGCSITLNNISISVYAIYRDITERKQTEKHLKYISYHDSLTGLYNRLYFEQQMQAIQTDASNPMSIIICDLNGLKFVNDTMGHDAGDLLLLAATQILKEVFGEDEAVVIARVGGDEFAIILRHHSKYTQGKIHELHNAIDNYNIIHPELPLSLSAGYASTDLPLINIHNIYKEADNNMYREKLLCRQSAHNAIVETLKKALEARDFITEGHGERLQDFVVELANTLELPGPSISNLRLLAQFHDIGKVGIPDRILYKPGPLSPREMAIMRTHCEIGHRIALASPDLTPIAEGILRHHEWWDGNGYPFGLKGEEIPIECRILAIADAYDAMTNDRPYRKACSRSDALLELKKCSGVQFDPYLVEIFISCSFSRVDRTLAKLNSNFFEQI